VNLTGGTARKRHRVMRRVRVASQALCLVLFFFLFIKTDYNGTDTIDLAVNLLFRIDPLLALSAMLAARTVIALLLPALVVVVLSVLLGRSFCGWLCPVGSLLDLCHPLLPPRDRQSSTLFPRAATILLLFVLLSAALRLPLAGYVDPFSILVRGLAQALYPAFHDLSLGFFTFTYHHAPAAVNAISEPLYELMQATVLPASQKFYNLALLSLVMLAAIFLAELVQRRFFCRNLCPLGALLGWLARRGWLGLSGGDEHCGKCRHCIEICRMGAIDSDRTIDRGRCSLCMECLEQCPRQIIAFGSRKAVSAGRGVSLSRRQLLTTLSTALLIPPVLGVRRAASRPNPEVIRPPGALGEDEFVQRCVRCAECIQVCIGNGLQPSLLEAGIEGIFTPRLVARSGYCEFNCTLCGQVCPTGAIRRLSLEEKQTIKIGHAWFDKNSCLPYAKAIPCMVCEEHCPTPDKAIKFRSVRLLDDSGTEVAVQQPYVVDALCIGCGICQTKCPLPGRSAIFVTSDGESRNPDRELPTRPQEGYGG